MISIHASIVVGQIQSSPGPGFDFRCQCFSLFIDFCGTSSFLAFGISFREQAWNLARRHHARFVSRVRFLFVFSVRAQLAQSAAHFSPVRIYRRCAADLFLSVGFSGPRAQASELSSPLLGFSVRFSARRPSASVSVGASIQWKSFCKICVDCCR
jgi:hypothetical protein